MKGRRGSRGDEERPSGRGHVVANMLVVPRADRAVAREVLGEPQEWTDRDLMERLGGLQEDDVSDIREVVEIFHVDSAGHRARDVRLQGGVRASPVHELGHLSHSKVMSGDGPYDDIGDVDVDIVQSQEVDREAPVIAVVDSGIVDEDGLPEWMRSPSVEAEQRDREEPDGNYDLPASHGTFVVSLLRQCAPDHAVWLASARAREKRHDPRHHAPAPGLTTELDVVAALARLKRRLTREDRSPVALNLSLGAHSNHPYEDDFLLAVKLALADWRAEFDCPIFAAGGNVEESVDPNPVYPGAFEGVTSVGALDECAKEVVWDAEGQTQDGSWRDWIDELDYGVNRIGLSGNSDAEVVRWSGSSFATALVTAAHITP